MLHYQEELFVFAIINNFFQLNNIGMVQASQSLQFVDKSGGLFSRCSLHKLFPLNNFHSKRFLLIFQRTIFLNFKYSSKITNSNFITNFVLINNRIRSGAKSICAINVSTNLRVIFSLINLTFIIQFLLHHSIRPFEFFVFGRSLFFCPN